MALKALMLRKKIDLKKKALEELRKNQEALEKREQELVISIDEVNTEEEQAAVQESVDTLIEEKEKLQESVDELDRVIKELEDELQQEEDAQDTTPPAAAVEPTGDERSKKIMNVSTRTKFFGMNLQERTAFFARDDVKAYLGEVRSSIKEKRAMTNVGLTVPEVFLGLIRENIENYSKLYKHVTVRPVRGTGRQLIMGTIPEGIWTDCCANLNELTLAFNDLEMDCFKVGGYFAICNANLEDSDLDLAAELLTTLGQALGIALDKAILYGRNAATTQKMPQGIVSRLVQTAAPGPICTPPT